MKVIRNLPNPIAAVTMELCAIIDIYIVIYNRLILYIQNISGVKIANFYLVHVTIENDNMKTTSRQGQSHCLECRS